MVNFCDISYALKMKVYLITHEDKKFDISMWLTLFIIELWAAISLLSFCPFNLCCTESGVLKCLYIMFFFFPF